MNDSRFERKTFLAPEAMVKLLFAIRGGQFLDDPSFDLQSLLQEIDFPIGEESKKAKLESARIGNVLVSRSIVTVTNEAAGSMRVLLSHRDSSHLITQGSSILTSGDPRISPDKVLEKKVLVTPEPTEFDRLGFALSSPEKTGGVNYLFEVFRARIAANAQIQTLKDHGTLLSPDEARTAIADKPLELEILNKISQNLAA